VKRAFLFANGAVLNLILAGIIAVLFVVGTPLEFDRSKASAAPLILGGTIVVSSTADAGPGTFRQSLQDAQGGDTITFDPAVFPPENPVAITALSPLPGLDRGGITIDAGSAGVILDGRQLLRERREPGLAITSSGNLIQGLQILHFAGSGISIIGGAQNNRVGGTRTGQRNIIGDNWEGVHIAGSDTISNTVIGNYIGINASGAAMGNRVDGVWIGDGAQGNRIGGSAAGEGNVISANGNTGVVIDNGMHNTVTGNYIGTDVTGSRPLANGNNGVSLNWGSQYNLVGGDTPEERNVISGNGREGVWIGNNGTMYNTVSGNYIGTDAGGIAAIGNRESGLSIGDGAQNNRIGGETPGAGNLISGNVVDGIVIHGPNTRDNLVCGNFIGTNADGTAAIPNGNIGVNLALGAQYNVIGGDDNSCRNLVSGNANYGVHLAGESVTDNVVIGNFIGTDVTGTYALGNTVHGVALGDRAQHNRVGGDNPGEGNLIAGNGDGVRIDTLGTMYNTVAGNFIGTDVTGTGALGNIEYGVIIHSGAALNIIGSGNIIAYNGSAGIGIRGPETSGNTITANAIHDNGAAGIETVEGGNAGLLPPAITHIDSRTIRGVTLPEATIELFSDKDDEGGVFAGSAISGTDGDFLFRLPAGRFASLNFTATATDQGGNTSAFSVPVSPPIPAMTRELPGIVAPSQVSVEPGVIGTNLGLALFCVLIFGFTSTVFNSILEDYRDEIVSGFRRLLPRIFAGALHRLDQSIHRLTRKGRGRFLVIWIVVLALTALMESFLDPGLALICPERLGLLTTLFVSALVVSALELGSDLYAHRRWASRTRATGKIQWIGLLIAIVCVIVSRALDFKPGYLYGIVGATYLIPKIADAAISGKRALFVLLTILSGSAILWIATAFLPAGLAELEAIFLTIFLIGLQGVFFQLFPLAVTDGGDIWGWRKGIWFLLFAFVFFAFFHLLLNPSASDVQALQQNGVHTLLVLILVFGLATAILWLLLPFRLRRMRAR
jgi:hypothetical protein